MLRHWGTTSGQGRVLTGPTGLVVVVEDVVVPVAGRLLGGRVGADETTVVVVTE